MCSGGLGQTEWIIIFGIVLLLFGGKKLPGLARSIGSGISEFKKGMSGKLDEESNTDESSETSKEIDSQSKTTTQRKTKAKQTK